MTLYAILIFSGLLVGFLSSFFGVGGGVLIVPVLYSFFPNIPPVIVISCSLAIIFINGFINLFHFRRSGKSLKLNNLALMFPGILIGVFIGSQLMSYIGPDKTKLTFGFILILVCLKTLLSKVGGSDNEQFELKSSKIPYFIITCTLGGIIQSLTGLGGGMIFVPLFISLIAMPLSWVPVYSNACMIIGSLNAIFFNYLSIPNQNFAFPKFIQLFQFSHLNFFIIGLFVLGSLFSSPLGVKYTSKVGAKTKKYLFSTVLLLAAFRIILQTLR